MLSNFTTKTLASATAMSASFNSTAFNIERTAVIGIQAVWSGGGSPVGTLKLQVSNAAPDETGSTPLNAPTGATWTDVSGSSTSVSADGDYFWNIAELGARWVRLVWTRTSGSGSTLTAVATGKW